MSGSEPRSPRVPPGAQVDVDDLLSIDVGAEVRKLAQAQLESPAQLPVELVRRSLAARARTVAVTSARRSFAVRDDGSPLGAATLDALAVLLDVGAAPDARHEALLCLERAGDLALLALAGMEAAAIRVRSGGRSLSLRRGGRPELASAPGDGTTVEVGGAPLDAATLREALAQACRFTSVPVVLDGMALARPGSGFGEVVREDVLAGGLTGRLAIPIGGETARVWITLDGILAAHVAVAGAPCFEAVVEARPLLAPGAMPPAAALREALAPHVDAISHQAIEILERAARAGSILSASAHTRVRELALIALRRGLAPASLRSVPLFRAVDGHGAEPRLVSVDDIAAIGAASPGGSVIALFPGHDPRSFLLPGGAVPILDAVERGRLSSVLGLSFRPPQPRRAERSALARLASAFASLRHTLATALRRARDPFGARPVADDELTAEERSFAQALARQLMDDAFESVAVRFVQGAGPIRTSRGRALLLPRANPTVLAAVRAAGRDPGWLYAAALAFESAPRPGARSLYWR